MEKIKYFFSETRPFLSTFCKKCIFTIENPKKKFQTMIKLLLNKQILHPQMPDFAVTCAMMAATHEILSTTHTILALPWFCHLKKKPRGGGA